MSNPFEAAFEHQQQPQNPIEVIEHQIADTNAKADNLNGRVARWKPGQTFPRAWRPSRRNLDPSLPGWSRSRHGGKADGEARSRGAQRSSVVRICRARSFFSD